MFFVVVMNNSKKTFLLFVVKRITQQVICSSCISIFCEKQKSCQRFRIYNRYLKGSTKYLLGKKVFCLYIWDTACLHFQVDLPIQYAYPNIFYQYTPMYISTQQLQQPEEQDTERQKNSQFNYNNKIIPDIGKIKNILWGQICK